MFHKERFAFSKLLELQYYFPENFRCNLTFYKSEIVSILLSPLHLRLICEPENFRFPFHTKTSPTLGVKCEKIKFRKS